ncbi:hypothetical protein BDV37DRAFT_89019 [Aspergillus pseudonomiae]|uniref:Secreted protein n=1 Tax=Aspergillus pseudonomiae TaxID=1506151 RepID=A0A5N7DGG4_9EURO|nr:uncharacterized protein BDV37DRAFT_89019 [Aspergillus pseudonomiae]KAE8405511.1 hypothetical protein BDV37DRAFT_89019 [Aspergillus pseudonomiae]
MIQCLYNLFCLFMCCFFSLYTQCNIPRIFMTTFPNLTLERRPVKVSLCQQSRPAGPMARRLTTNQEIAGSIPASVNFLCFAPVGE